MPPAHERVIGVRSTLQPASARAEASRTSSPPRQTSFWLTNQDIQLTDEWVHQLRRNGWPRANRSACIRAMIDRLREANVDLTGVIDEAALIRAMRQALSQHQP